MLYDGKSEAIGYESASSAIDIVSLFGLTCIIDLRQLTPMGHIDRVIKRWKFTAGAHQRLSKDEEPI